MKKILMILTLCAASTVGAFQPMNLPFEQHSSESLVIHNRILLKVGGKYLSVMDVVKKMDLLFYRQYPDLTDNIVARYQFYTNAWRPILDSVIDDALMAADAEEKKIEISDGEVREALQNLFGPNVVLNLDKIGMTLTEAFDMLKTELIVQRMTGMMVRSKALSEVHPKKVRELYEDFLKKNPPQDVWVYQVLSIRGEAHERVAKKAEKLLSKKNIPFESILAHIEKEKGVEVSLSDELKRPDGDISLAHKAVLQTVSMGKTSTAITKPGVSRIFCLKEREKGAPKPLKELQDELKSEITQEAYERHDADYRQKLRQKYGMTEKYLSEVIPEGLEPFALR